VNRHTTCTFVFVLLSGALVAALASPPAIGTATARGQFLLDSATVQGNATLLEGSVVETRSMPSVLRLQGGAQMTIGSASRGTVYGDRLVLERGEGRLEGARQYRIEASTLQVLPDSSATAARVAYGQPGKITVAALTGSVQVTTANGVLLARLAPGMVREFEPQAAGASASVSVAGCVAASEGLILLKDDTANLSFELRGQDLARYEGQRVAISATPLRDVKPTGTAAQVLHVTQVKPLGGGCPAARAGAAAAGAGAATAAGAGAATAAGAGAATAAAAVTTKVVIAGVAVAAVAGGTALGLTGDDESKTISR